jgi:hypothetical protein
MSAGSQKNKHHTNPQLSLRKFRDSKLEGYDIWQYEKGELPKPVLIENAAMQENFNTVILAGTNIENKNIIEDALQQYEGKAGEVLKAIESGKQISPQQKLHLSKFLCLQLVRVPKFRDWVVEKDKQSLGMEPSSKIALRFLDTKHSHFFNDVKWEFLIAPDNAGFVTSDNPLSIHKRPNFTGWLYPLSPAIALASSADEDRVRKLEPNHVDQINLFIIQAAQRFVYASNRSDVIQQMVQEHINTSPYIPR